MLTFLAGLRFHTIGAVFQCCDELDQTTSGGTGEIPASECDGGLYTSGINNNRQDHCSGFSGSHSIEHSDGSVFHLGGYCRAAIYTTDLSANADAPPPPGEWGDWVKATPANLEKIVVNANIQYKYQGANGGYYLTPVTDKVWQWNSYQSLDGEYSYSMDGSDSLQSFNCGHVEQGHIGIGCSNGGGNQWKVFTW